MRAGTARSPLLLGHAIALLGVMKIVGPNFTPEAALALLFLVAYALLALFGRVAWLKRSSSVRATRVLRHRLPAPPPPPRFAREGGGAGLDGGDGEHVRRGGLGREHGGRPDARPSFRRRSPGGGA